MLLAAALVRDLHLVAGLMGRDGRTDVVGDVTATPSTDVITSPAWMPAAAAAEPASTPVTTAPPSPTCSTGARDTPSSACVRHLASAQLVDHRLRRIDGDGEADVLGLPGDRGVDADDVALEVEQRAAGVARVDRGVGLQEVGEVLAVGLGEAAVLGRHDPGRHRRPAGEVEGVADGDDLVAHLEGIGVAQRKGSEVVAVDVQDGEVRSGICGDDLGGDLITVAELDGDIGRRRR